jgi:hypothetical protein
MSCVSQHLSAQDDEVPEDMNRLTQQYQSKDETVTRAIILKKLEPTPAVAVRIKPEICHECDSTKRFHSRLIGAHNMYYGK